MLKSDVLKNIKNIQNELKESENTKNRDEIVDLKQQNADLYFELMMSGVI